MLRLCLKEKPFYQGGLKNAYALFWALMLWVLCSPHKRINEWIYSSVIYNDWDSITPVIKVTTKWLNMLQYYCSFFTEEKESLLVSSVILSVNRFCYLQNLQCLNHYNTTKQILFISQFLKCRTVRIQTADIQSDVVVIKTQCGRSPMSQLLPGSNGHQHDIIVIVKVGF